MGFRNSGASGINICASVIIGLADGSVQTTTTSALQSALVNTGTATNRLVIP